MREEMRCPECGERERLSASRDGERMLLACDACGHGWERHPDSCPRCWERGLVMRRVPLFQRARGTQQSIIGYRTARECRSCGWASGDEFGTAER